MTYEEIVAKTREYAKGYDVSDYIGHFAMEVDIFGEGEGAFYVEIKDKQLYIEPYEYYDRDCRFIVSGDDFIHICSGELDAVELFTKGRLKVEGDIEKALGFSAVIMAAKQKIEAEKAEKEAKAAESKPAGKKAEEKPKEKAE